MRYIIIGGGIAGITAAQTLHDGDPTAEVTVYTSDIHPFGFYERKALAQQLGRGLRDPESLLLDSAEELRAEGIDFQYKEIVRVFPDLRQVLKAHHLRRAYDKLLLAVGATPRLVRGDGMNLQVNGVHQLRHFDDANMIEAWMPALRQQGAVILGGSVLALDVAFALRQRGVPVTLVVREAHVGYPLLTEPAAQIIEDRLRRDGVEVLLNTTLHRYLSDDGKLLDAVQLSDGRVLTTRMALSCIGVRASTDFLDESGIEIDDETGALPVNAYLQTNVPDIYAAGNCALLRGITSRNWHVSAEQGRIAALNMLGQRVPFDLPVTLDLESRLYDLPFAYFGSTQPQRDAQTWTWQSDDQAATVLLNGDRIVGAALLGSSVVGLGETLLQRHQDGIATTIREIETLIGERDLKLSV